MVRAVHARWLSSKLGIVLQVLHGPSPSEVHISLLQVCSVLYTLLTAPAKAFDDLQDTFNAETVVEYGSSR